VREFDAPAAVVVKHTNPSGVAVADTLVAAYRGARDADALSAFGGIVALSRRVDLATAQALAETFLEAVVAPGFDDDALALLHTKKNLRLLDVGVLAPASQPGAGAAPRLGWIARAGPRRPRRGRGGRRQGGDAPRADGRGAPDALEFVWRVTKHVKSNAIVLATQEAGLVRTVGVGAGQMSRVVSVDIACRKAGAASSGAVLGSDAFFPFADGLERAAEAGVSAVVQPGGSVRDEEVIAAADRAGIAMIFTGARHFRH
jgi:phosphoribosylaminoimidazolecarboxamide formyltransferase/IMP cyclohydrolase